MRTFLLTGISVLALAASITTASAGPITFGYDGNIVQAFTAPATGVYDVVAVGARGGSVLDQGGTGGLGAEAGGTFSLVQGELLRILVGGAGADDPTVTANFEGFAGGGGGSFVVGPNGLPLVVAGGGGGGGQLSAAYPPNFQEVRGGARYDGGDALTGPDGGASTVAGDTSVFGPFGGAGGSGGADGQGGLFSGGGRSAVNAGRGFDSFPSGLGAGAGGGGGLADSNAGAGGGGGYSGGGGGGLADVSGSFRYGVGGGGGGGGGSFTAGIDPVLLARVGTSDGTVTISPAGTSVPEPASLALFGTGLAGLFTLRRRR